MTCAAFAACASDPAPKRAETYVDRVELRVLAARDDGRYLLRHNPADACGCPPFEVKLGEVWHRVAIGGEVDDPAIVSLLEATATPEVHDRRVFEVEARLDDEVALCGRGGLYVSLVPTAFVGVVGAAP